MIFRSLVDKFSRALGPDQPVGFFFAFGLPILFLSRVGLGFWQAERINETGIGWVTFFLLGLRADLILISLLSIPVLVLVPIFLPTPSRSVVKLSLSQTGFFTLASLLGGKGHATEFINGGEAHFDNMRLFFTGNGFQSIIEQKDFKDPDFVATWGVSDEDLFRRADERFAELHAGGEPFFSLVFSSSNHEPFEYPEGRIERHDEEAATVNNAVKYADYALGEFFKAAKSRDYWKDTIFLVVADHDTRVFGSELVPVKNFHIPGLILGADLSPQTIKTVASQIDLPTTLLSLMGISAEHPMIGRDLSQAGDEEPGRAFMQFGGSFCMMEGNDLVILRAEKEPVFGRYDPVRKAVELGSGEDPERARRALAYALLPSWLYRNQLYK